MSGCHEAEQAKNLYLMKLLMANTIIDGGQLNWAKLCGKASSQLPIYGNAVMGHYLQLAISDSFIKEEDGLYSVRPASAYAAATAPRAISCSARGALRGSLRVGSHQHA